MDAIDEGGGISMVGNDNTLNAVIAVGRKVGGAVVCVRECETKGETFTGIGIEDDRPFLEGPNGRQYLGPEAYSNALFAMEQGVIMVLELGIGDQEREYAIDAIAPPLSMGM